MITIICSNLNSLNWIDGYLESINAQFYKVFEIQFIDGGSTDGSWERIKKFEFRNGIKSSYIQENYCSIYKAWNIGYNKSNTEYCINVNTDDRLFPNGLEIMAVYAKKYKDIDVFYSPCLITDNKDHGNYSGIYDWPDFSKGELLKRCICGPFPLVKLRSAIEVGLFNSEFTISGDYEMWLRMASKGKRFMKIKEPIGGYYINPSGLSTNPKTLNEHLLEDEKLRRIYGNSINKVPAKKKIFHSIKNYLKAKNITN